MATIGLDSMYYAVQKVNPTGLADLFGTPKKLAGAINVQISVETAEAKLYADDGLAEIVKEFSGGSISLNVADLADEALADITGTTKDAKGVMVSSAGDAAPVVAIGYRARKSNGEFRYFWLYSVKFGPQGHNLTTKGESIEWNTPTIEGLISTNPYLKHNEGKAWKAEVTVADTSTEPASNWFTKVYTSANTTFDGTGAVSA